MALLCNPQINSMVVAWPNEKPAGNVWCIATHREYVPPDQRTEAH